MRNSPYKTLQHFFLLCLLVVSGPLPSQEMTEEELERWFEDDDAPLPYQKRGGSAQLEFLAPITDRSIPYSHTRLSFTANSMASGWVAIAQCHHGLDAVPDAEVVYRFEQMRGLIITETYNIAEARIEGQSVQLRNISRGGRLCVEMEAKLLKHDNDGKYRLRYGPYMRKFLDSYFPMHVALEVNYPSALLILDKVSPAPEEGMSLKQKSGWLGVEAWFRGMLVIELQFHQLQ